MKFSVNMEHRISDTVEVEAETYEEAVAIARKDHGIRQMTVKLSATWVERSEYTEAYGVLCHEIVGDCGICGNAMFIPRMDDGEKHLEAHPDWPWYYGSMDESNDYAESACYSCLQSPLKQLAEAAE